MILMIDTDGAGLACAVFEHFLRLRQERPKILGATHFHEIFEHGFVRPRPHLSFGHMEIRVDVEAEHVENQVTYLYKYSRHSFIVKFAHFRSFKSGRSISSFGSR